MREVGLYIYIGRGVTWVSGRGLDVRVLDSALWSRAWVRSPHWAWFAFEV